MRRLRLDCAALQRQHQLGGEVGRHRIAAQLLPGQFLEPRRPLTRIGRIGLGEEPLVSEQPGPLEHTLGVAALLDPRRTSASSTGPFGAPVIVSTTTPVATLSDLTIIGRTYSSRHSGAFPCAAHQCTAPTRKASFTQLAGYASSSPPTLPRSQRPSLSSTRTVTVSRSKFCPARNSVRAAATACCTAGIIDDDWHLRGFRPSRKRNDQQRERGHFDRDARPVSAAGPA